MTLQMKGHVANRLVRSVWAKRLGGTAARASKTMCNDPQSPHPAAFCCMRSWSIAVLIFGILELLNAADPAAVRRLLASTADAAQLRGVWHAAGVLSDALLARQTSAMLARVYGPKAHGAWALQRGTAALALEACALFSSVAALLGGSGQVGALP